jgi:septal ring factor EnvC (AmiA/AmiB activator)
VKKGRDMGWKKISNLLACLGLIIFFLVCGNSMSEDEMVIRELRLSKGEIAALTEELDQVKKEKNSLTLQVKQLKEQVVELQKSQNPLTGQPNSGKTIKKYGS